MNIDNLGKKRVLRLEPTKLDLESLASALSESEMDAVPKDHYITDLENGLWSATFRTRKIDKRILKLRVEGALGYNKRSPLKKSKKEIKAEVLADMLATAPITTTEAFFFINDNYLYIFGSHKKVIETIFSGSSCIPDPYNSLTTLWEESGNPCDNITISNGEWTRSFKTDGKDAALTAVQEGGEVLKFSDVFSYSICLGHLVTGGEFTDIDSVDQVIDKAELTLSKGEKQ